MSSVFISYSRADAAAVDQVREQLSAQGIEIWIDRGGIVAGENWAAQITQAIRECRAFVLILSAHSAASSEVPKELAIAANHRRAIIPVTFDGCEVPATLEYQLAGLQMVDFSQKPRAEALEELAASIRRASAVQAPSATLPEPQAAAGRPAPRRSGGRALVLGAAGVAGLAVLAAGLVGVSSKTAPDAGKPVLAHLKTRLYQLPGCEGYDHIQEDQRVSFASPADAEKAGYRRAARCQPQGELARLPVRASTRTKNYLTGDCPPYDGIWAQYRVEFKSIAEAEAAGYTRARECPAS